jgi:hypothetical protein
VAFGGFWNWNHPSTWKCLMNLLFFQPNTLSTNSQFYVRIVIDGQFFISSLKLLTNWMVPVRHKKIIKLEKLIFRMKLKIIFVRFYDETWLTLIDSTHAVHKLSCWLCITRIISSHFNWSVSEREKRKINAKFIVEACLHCGFVWNLLLKML